MQELSQGDSQSGKGNERLTICAQEKPTDPMVVVKLQEPSRRQPQLEAPGVIDWLTAFGDFHPGSSQVIVCKDLEFPINYNRDISYKL